MTTQYAYSIHQKRHELLSQLVTKLLHVEVRHASSLGILRIYHDYISRDRLGLHDEERSPTALVLCCSLLMRTTALPWISAYKRLTTTVSWTSTQERLRVYMRST